MLNKVKEYRQRAGITQTQLAEKTGFSRQTIINIERGNKSYHHYWTMKVIADTLGVPVKEIFML